MKKAVFSLTERRANWGYLFILPWLLGFAFLFAYPLIQSIYFSLSRIELTPGGYTTTFIGIENYLKALTVNPDFNRRLFESLQYIFTHVPIVVIFSLFAAVILNQNFKGRTISRVIFFLPVIFYSGALLTLQDYSWMDEFARGARSVAISADMANNGDFFLRRWLLEAGFALDIKVISVVVDAIDEVWSIVNTSGVQILIFLAGLQSISPSVYEASYIEGASGWEIFWKVTFPMISPLIIVNLVYTVIDTFTAPYNLIMRMIRDTALKGTTDLGGSAAMAWIYFVVMAVLLGLILAWISKKVFYEV